MSDTKRKTFAFHQEDLDWINPLILEWADENQGKEKGDLITDLLHDYRQDKEKGDLIAELLQDYRQDKEQATQHQERAQRLQDAATRIAKPIQATLNPVRSFFGKALHKFTEKTDTLHLDTKLDKAEHRIDATLTRAGTGINRLAGDATQRLRELRKTE